MVDQLLVTGWAVTVAAQRFHADPKTVHNWRRASVEAGRDGPARDRRRWSSRELELEAALGEVQVQPRVWKKGAEHLPAPTQQPNSLATRSLVAGSWGDGTRGPRVPTRSRPPFSRHVG